VIRGRLPLDYVIKDLTGIFSVVPKETVQEAIRQAALMYFVEERQNATVEDEKIRSQERETFKKIAARMPEQFSDILKKVIETAPNPPPGRSPGLNLRWRMSCHRCKCP